MLIKVLLDGNALREDLPLEYRTIAIHKVGQRPEIFAVKERDGDLGLSM